MHEPLWPLPTTVFFSYRRKDLARAQPLLAALDALGVRVWRDQTDLPDNAAITPNSRGVGGFQSPARFTPATIRSAVPCRQEITAGWIAAQQMGEPPYERVLVLNPEDGSDHLPQVLREQQSMAWPQKDQALSRSQPKSATTWRGSPARWQARDRLPRPAVLLWTCSGFCRRPVALIRFFRSFDPQHHLLKRRVQRNANHTDIPDAEDRVPIVRQLQNARPAEGKTRDPERQRQYF